MAEQTLNISDTNDSKRQIRITYGGTVDDKPSVSVSLLEGDEDKNPDKKIPSESVPLVAGVNDYATMQKISAGLSKDPDKTAILFQAAEDKSLQKDTLTALATNGTVPQSANPISPKEQLIGKIRDSGAFIGNNGQTDEHLMRLNLQLKSEDWLEQYEKTLSSMKIEDNINSRTSARVAATLAADQQFQSKGFMRRDGKPVPSTQQYDDIQQAAKLVGKPNLSPAGHLLVDRESEFHRNLSRLSEDSLHVFVDTLNGYADSNGVIPPNKLQKAFNVAKDKTIEAGEKQAKARSGFDYLQPGETEKYLNKALIGMCDVSPTAEHHAGNDDKGDGHPGGAAQADDKPHAAAEIQSVPLDPPAQPTPSETAKPVTSRSHNGSHSRSHASDDEITERLNRQELDRVTHASSSGAPGTAAPAPWDGSATGTVRPNGHHYDFKTGPVIKDQKIGTTYGDKTPDQLAATEGRKAEFGSADQINEAENRALQNGQQMTAVQASSSTQPNPAASVPVATGAPTPLVPQQSTTHPAATPPAQAPSAKGTPIVTAASPAAPAATPAAAMAQPVISTVAGANQGLCGPVTAFDYSRHVGYRQCQMLNGQFAGQYVTVPDPNAAPPASGSAYPGGYYGGYGGVNYTASGSGTYAVASGNSYFGGGVNARVDAGLSGPVTFAGKPVLFGPRHGR